MKKIFSFLNIIKLSILIMAILCLKNTTSIMEATSTNENVNKSINLSTMALYINKEEEERNNEQA